jgi:hypothetical protein
MVTGKKEEITKLAMKLANEELASGSKSSPSDLLDALDTVAKLVEKNAGGQQEVKNLASQVQKLVDASR